MAAALIAATAMVLSFGACGSNRPPARESLVIRQREYERQVLEQRDLFRATVLARLEDKAAKAAAAGRPVSEPVTFDMLLLSSGGQNGAFGVGFLQGWAKSGQPSCSRPEFDFVTGVSTGAMISPFALVGTEDSIRRIEQLYQEVDDNFAALRDLLFFLPWRESFFDNDKLRERLDAEIDPQLIEMVAKADTEHRMLLVGTTDVDLGRMVMWNLGAMAHDPANIGRIRKVMLASAAIPAAFPPVLIDNALHVDGGTTQQAFVGLDREEIVSMAREFASRVPGRSPPRLRLWVLVNGKIDQDPQFVKNQWVTLAGRSVGTLMSYSMRTTLRHLEFGCELITRDLGVPMEFHYVAVPAAFETPETSSLFDKETMARLMEKGREMGMDPASWRSSVGPVEVANAEPGEAPVPAKPADRPAADVPPMVPPRR